LNNRLILALVLLVQIVCAGFFVGQILISVLGLPIGPVSWSFHELIEIGAAFGLLIGVALSALALRSARARSEKAEQALRHARSAFHDVLQERFAAWGLTRAEKDVALFAIKGFSTHDIAELRGVSEGTIKALGHLISQARGDCVFIDGLVDDP